MEHTTWPPEALTHLQQWYAHLRRVRHRGLIWCDEREVAAWLNAVGDCWPVPHITFALDEALHDRLPAAKHYRLSQARDALGQEASLAVMDLRHGMDPDALGAIGGVLVAGGILLLITSDATFEGRFGRRLHRLLIEHEDVVRAWQTIPASMSQVLAAKPPSGPTPEQQALVDRILALSSGEPLVVTAPRGRGKSAALGMAAAALLSRAVSDVWVTAPRAASVASLFMHLERQCPEGRREGNRFYTASGCVRFVAPDAMDEAITHATSLPLLMVDEAAALPVSYVLQWMQQFPQLVLATTLQGYEGSGQGFARAVAAQLIGPSLSLTTPVRWAADDPLEAWIAQVLCLNAWLPEAPDADAAWHIAPLDRERLLTDEPLLNAVFGLLTHAHYRTTPRDLMTWLEHAEVTLLVAWHAQTPLGIVACVDEGGLDPELAEAVTAGLRRTQGHLLAQTLALHSGDPRVAEAKWCRITRIAVHPKWRRQGMGAQLVAAAEHHARERGCTLMGASFGGTLPLISFWQAQAYRAMRTGLKVDKVTGERAVVMGKALMTSAPCLADGLHQTFMQQLPLLAAVELRAWSPTLLAALMLSADASLTDDDCHWLKRVGQAHAPIASARSALQQGFMSLSASSPALTRTVLVGVLFQGRDWAWCAAQLNMKGKRDAEQWLRSCVLRWVDASTH